MLFIKVMDMTIKETVKQGPNGTQWSFARQLHSLNFADEI